MTCIDRRKRRRDRALGIAFLAVLGALVCLVYFRERLNLPPMFCVVRVLTGYDCPGCGGTRALSALLRLDIARALRMNAFLTPLLPVIAYIVLAELLRMIAGRTVLPQIPLNPWVIALLGVAFIAFGILRNLPAFAFLAPG
jgi:hypothetical protein